MWRRMKKKHRFLVCACASVLVLSYFAAVYIQQETRMKEIGAENERLQQELDALMLRQAALEGDLESASSDAYIERLAREELGFIKEGEIRFVEAPKQKENASGEYSPPD